MKYKVLFLIPPFSPIFEGDSGVRGGRHPFRARYPHLGIAYLAAVLRQRGVTFNVVDMNLGYSLPDVLHLVKLHTPAFIGVTVFSAGYRTVYSLIESLRSHYEGAIAAGGPHISVTGGQVRSFL